MSRSSTILVVDDDELTRQLLQSLLEMETDYQVMFAHDGAEALEMAAQTPPDVILLDILMPGIDGFEVCRKLRANPVLRQVPIVLLTGLEGRTARLRGLEAGADEFLNKPVDLVELRTRLRTITELNRFRQLSDERGRFEAAVNHSPEAIVLTDGQGRVLHANASFAALVGQTPGNVLDCFPSSRAVALRAQLAMLERAGTPIGTFESRLARSAKAEATVEVTLVRLPWSEGTMLEFILHDISERKHLEQQLVRFQRIDLLGQLASGVLHDLNSLLSQIQRATASAEQAGAPKVAGQLAEIRESSERGMSLLRRILMFAHGTDQSLHPVNVSAVLLHSHAIAEKTLGPDFSLQLSLPAGLPEIIGDAGHIEQIVMNLCLNARDAMPQGGSLSLAAQPVTLTPETARALGPDAAAGDFVAISVADRGTGIPPEHQSRLFDPFFTTKPRGTAPGLGLATVLRLMRRHHGFVNFESKVGEGTRFTCYFPLVRS